MPVNPITIVDSFIYPKKDGRRDLDIGHELSEAYKSDIRQLDSRAYSANPQKLPVTLLIAGDSKAGMRCVVQCDDADTKQRVQEAIAAFFKEQGERSLF